MHPFEIHNAEGFEPSADFLMRMRGKYDIMLGMEVERVAPTLRR